MRRYAVTLILLLVSVAGAVGSAEAQGFRPRNRAGTALRLAQPTSFPSAVEDLAYPTVAIQPTGGSSPYTCSVTVGSLPTGITASGSAPYTNCTYSGTPTTPGTSTFTITVTDNAGRTLVLPYSVTILPAPTALVVAEPAVFPQGRTSLNYTKTRVVPSGGQGPYACDVTTGDLPDGVVETDECTYEGIPSAINSFDFTITVTDALGSTATRDYTVAVVQGSPLQIASPGYGNGYWHYLYDGDSFSAITITPTGGVAPYTCELVLITGFGADSLDDLHLTESSECVFDTDLSEPLDFADVDDLDTDMDGIVLFGRFNVLVTDSDGNTATTADGWTWALSEFPALVVVGPTSVSGVVGTPITPVVFTASGGRGAPYFCSFTGSLPMGITESSECTFTGTPSATYSNSILFDIHDTDETCASGCTASSFVFPWTITASTPASDPLRISSPTAFPNGSLYHTYSVTIVPLGGTGTGYTCSVDQGSFPIPVTETSECVYSGVPVEAVTRTVRIRVTDSSSASVTGDFSYTIDSADPLAIQSPSSFAAVEEGTAMTATTVTGTGGSESGYTCTVTGTLPTGVTESSDCVFTGTPTTRGTYPFTVTLTDSLSHTATREYTFIVTAPSEPLTFIGPQTFPTPHTRDVIYVSQSIQVSGGAGGNECTISAGSLPDGITETSECIYGGTPTVANTFNFTVKVTDDDATEVTKAYTVVIAAPPVPIPAPWDHADIGQPGRAGDASITTSGVWTITGAGTIFGAADGFHYAYQAVTGDQEIVANVTACTTTGAFGQTCGVMVRTALTANAPNLLCTAGTTTPLLQWRLTTGGATGSLGATGTSLRRYRITVVSNIAQCATSTDGVTWTAFGSAQTLPISGTYYVGLAVSASSNVFLATGTISDVTVQTMTVVPPTQPKKDFGGYRPHYQGFSANTTAGRGPVAAGANGTTTVCAVNVLTGPSSGSQVSAASGTTPAFHRGSLRYCVATLTVPRTVVFETAGTINMGGTLTISSPHITVAGQTAPSPGVTLSNGSIVVDTHDVVLQHFRLRCGASAGNNAVGITARGTATSPTFNLVLDHLSVTWCGYLGFESGLSLGTTYPQDILIADTMFAENMKLYTAPGALPLEALFYPIGCNGTLTFARNFMAHSGNRNPLIGVGWKAAMYNNVIYDWNAFAGDEGSYAATSVVGLTTGGHWHCGNTQVAFNSNAYVAGPRTIRPDGAIQFDYDDDIIALGGVKAYLKDNIGPAGEATAAGINTPCGGATNELQWTTCAHFQTRTDITPQAHPTRATSECNQACYDGATFAWHRAYNFQILGSADVQAHVVANVGARPRDRDAVDTRLVSEVGTLGGRYIFQSETETPEKGYPELCPGGVCATQSFQSSITAGNAVASGQTFRTNLEVTLEALACALEPSCSTPSLYVCATGTPAACGGSPAYSTLASAITAAQCGDYIRLKANETFTGRWTLPNKGPCGSTNPITITTTATSGMLPSEGQRLIPIDSDMVAEGFGTANTDTSLLPKLQPPQADSSAITTPMFVVNAGANGWTFKLVEFRNSFGGVGSLIRAGQNAAAAQPKRADQPDNIMFDQIYANLDETHPYWGQDTFLELHTKTGTVKNSYIQGANTDAEGRDSKTIYICNGQGPFLIRNNWIRGGTIPILTCGDTPWLHTHATVSGSASTTGAALTWAAGATPTGDCPFVGQTLAIASNDGLSQSYPTVATVSCGAAGNTATVTWSPAITQPNVGTGVRWGVTPGDASVQPSPASYGGRIEYNQISRDFAWWHSNVEGRRAPIIPAPTLSASATTGGSLAAGTYAVKAVYRTGPNDDRKTSDISNTVTVTVPASGKIAWSVNTPHADILFTRVYITPTGGTSSFIAKPPFTGLSGCTSTFGVSGEITAVGSTAIDGTCAGITTTSPGTPPAWGTTFEPDTWRFKNLLELKAGINFTIRYNELFNSWFTNIGAGHAIWNKSASNGSFNSNNGSEPWLENTSSIYEYNVVHHAPGFFQNSGWEYCGASSGDAARCTALGLWNKPKGTSGLIVRHNLAYRISNRDRDQTGATSTGFNGAENDAMLWANGCSGCSAEHNTIDYTGDAEDIALASSNAASSARYLSSGWTFRNNLVTRATTGIDSDCSAEGTASVTGACGTNGGASTVGYNVWGGSSPGGGLYPNQGTLANGNVFLTLANWRAQLTSPVTTLLGATPFDVSGYALLGASIYNNAGSDSADIGADITTIATEIAKTRAGNP